MTREWTIDDEEVAADLGFILGCIALTECRYVYYTDALMNHDVSIYAVDLYVWLLADAGEPTAVKALDIIEATDPNELYEMAKVVMGLTGGAE